MNPARNRGQTESPGGAPSGIPMALNPAFSSRETESMLPPYQVLQHHQLQQQLHPQMPLHETTLQQHHQQQHRHVIVPSSLSSHKQQEQIQQIHHMHHTLKSTHAGACAGRRSRSNSSLASPEKRSPSQQVNSRGSSKCCSRGSGCICTADTRDSFASVDCSRLSFSSTRSSTGTHPFGSRRYTTSSSGFNVSAVAPGPSGAPATAVSPSAAGPSTSLSVGGESCTDWGAISADDGGSVNTSNVFVAVRVRPLNEKEKRQGDVKTLGVLDNRSLMVTEVGADGGPRGRRVRNRYFIFDRVFGETADQEDIFEGCTLPLIQDLFKGINATVFAYGATAAGKTHTMLGNETAPGLMPRALQLLFQQGCSNSDNEFSMSCCFVEIYNETIRDLLGSKSDTCELREDPEKGVTLQHVTTHRLASPQQALLLLLEGNKRRTQEATDANQTSSRSHAILQVNIFSRQRGSEVQLAKLSLVDLAGSERASHTSNHGQRMTEGASINRSLLALGNVINALSQRSSSNTNSFGRFVPYRDSKLTRLLKDSLGGRCRTAMIATISPATSHQEETLNTLKYARRAKAIRNSTHAANAPRTLQANANESSAVAGLRAKLHELQCQLHRQELHGRLSMRRRMHAPRMATFLEQSEPTEGNCIDPAALQLQERERGNATPAGGYAAIQAVNLLFEDIDALATENALLTEQVAALQASLRESGDRFAFLQSLAQQQQQITSEGALAGIAAPTTSPAAAANEHLSWGNGATPALVPTTLSNSSQPSVAEGELQLLSRIRQEPRHPVRHDQLLLHQEEELEVPTEEQELQEAEGTEQQQLLQQQLQPLALQRPGVLHNKDTMQFDEYFSPQSAAPTDGSPTTGGAAGMAACTPAAPAAAESSGITTKLGLGPFRFFSSGSNIANRLCASAGPPHGAPASALPPSASAAPVVTGGFDYKSPLKG